MAAMGDLFAASPPRGVVVYGDVNSTVASALVCAKLGIPIAHVEAGLRSFDRTMPEEINRVVTDALADVLYVTSPEAMAHLAAEGIPPSRMRFVGNPMIDTMLRLRSRFDPDRVRHQVGLKEDRYAVATLHRPANVDNDLSARRLVAALHRVADMLPVAIPLHPRGSDRLNRLGLAEHERIVILEPLGYIEFMSLLSGAALVLTDSGGVQEETTVLGVPCLTLRSNTERPITVTSGTNRLVGDDPDQIVAAAEAALVGPISQGSPPLWDGKAGMRIALDLYSTFG